jgi:hypothetical protein
MRVIKYASIMTYDRYREQVDWLLLPGAARVNLGIWFCHILKLEREICIT